jgi:hypothetical protein
MKITDQVHLLKIKKSDFNILLSSWTEPLSDSRDITSLIEEGKSYMLKIDGVVKECYLGANNSEACKMAVAKLGLPPFLANPLVDKAFRSHL